MQQLNLSQIQAFLIHHNKQLPFAKYLLLQVKDAAGAKEFLRQLQPQISAVSDSADEQCIQVGFTNTGLLALGLSTKNLQTFSREFREGMVTPHRQRLLGDLDSSDSKNWRWGGSSNERLDLIVMIFAAGQSQLSEKEAMLKANRGFQSLKEVFCIDAPAFPEGREHFGFREGISQPVIIGSGLSGIRNDNIEAGEFVMGYKNEYGVFPDAPLLKESQGAKDVLADDAAGSANKDLGLDGTYFVLRQLQEDVDGFWSFLNEKTRNEDGSANPAESTKVAAKMMGRWPGGAPLVKYPDSDPEIISDDNDFNYIETDKLAMKCPFGSHVRRTNPRDNFEETGPAESLKLTKKHRIMRRVRSYGENFTASATNHKPAGEVGVMFGCFVADISRQFEFIQYTWANYPKFKQLYNDPDPFIGVRENPDDNVEQQFTIQQQNANRYITGLKNFVTVKGGAYFFFPSKKVITFLTTL